jgi:hypothetical protein
MKITVEVDETKLGFLANPEEIPVLMKALCELYGQIWCEACYDATNEQMEKFARRLLPHIEAVNAILKFKK